MLEIYIDYTVDVVCNDKKIYFTKCLLLKQSTFFSMHLTQCILHWSYRLWGKFQVKTQFITVRLDIFFFLRCYWEWNRMKKDNYNDLQRHLILMLIKWKNSHLEICILTWPYLMPFMRSIVLYGVFSASSCLSSVTWYLKNATTYFPILKVHRH